jgi:hypothetical protein
VRFRCAASLHSDSVEITADLTVSTVSESTKASPADIARITAIDIITSNAQIEKRASCNDYAYRISSLETTDITASTVVVSDRIISHNEIISDTASFRSIRIDVVDTPSVMTQNLSTTNLDATSAKFTLDSTDMKTSSFHTNTIDASGTIDAHIVRVSNTILLPSLHDSRLFRTIRPRRRCTPYQRYRRRNFQWSCRVSEHTDRLDVGKRWNIYDTCHGFGVGV